MKKNSESPTQNLGKKIYIYTKRPDGSVRIQESYENCPHMTEQHTSHLTDLNYLFKKYKPDELRAYLAAKSEQRQAIVGYDESKQFSLQEAKNRIVGYKNLFEKLPEDIKTQFPNYIHFCKFIENPANAEKMIKLGLIKKKDLPPDPKPADPAPAPPTPPTTPEEKK